LSAALKAAEETVGDPCQQFARLQPGDHICLIYENLEEQVAAFVPFLKVGLARGERCAYVVDDRSEEEVVGILAAHGIDVERERSQGALVFLAKRDAYLRSGCFVPEEMIDFLARSEAEALEAGFTGLRITGEATWALGPEPGCKHLIQYEALLGRFFPHSRVLAICQYNRRRFPPELIQDVLRTHPVVAIRGEVHANIFYEGPELMLGEKSVDERVEWMVAQLERVRRGERRLVTLGERLAEQAAENARLYAQAQAAVRLRDEFLSVASHELKTPLTPLQMRLQALRREAEAGGAPHLPCERVARTMVSLEQQVRRLAALVDDLLDVARLSGDRMRLDFEDVDLAEVAREVVARFAQQSAKAGCRVEVVAEEAVSGWWDRQRLEQVVTNLLSNALKYGAGRPVKVRVEAGPEQAVLVVQDAGIGIAPEHLTRIFERFERAVSGRHYGGLGLGLYITRQVVEALGGSISVESQMGEGSTFRVELPHQPGQAPGASRASAPLESVSPLG
jgi:signal transduction histidine kinase